jgi:hypothetical protein
LTSTAGDSPAAVGNRIAAAVLAFGASDGANEASDYADPTYTPVNEPLIVKLAGATMVDPNRWQPLGAGLHPDAERNSATREGPGVRRTAVGSRHAVRIRPLEPPRRHLRPGSAASVMTSTSADSSTTSARAACSIPRRRVRGHLSRREGQQSPRHQRRHRGIPTNPVTGAPVRAERRQARRLVPRHRRVLGRWAALRNSTRALESDRQLRVLIAWAPEKRIAGTGPRDRLPRMGRESCTWRSTGHCTTRRSAVGAPSVSTTACARSPRCGTWRASGNRPT